MMPPVRLVGGALLSWLTRLASGYRHIGDSQCGYTVASRRALAAIGPDLCARYGYPNDLLVRLAAARLRVVDVPVRPGLRAPLAFGSEPAARGAANRVAAAARALPPRCPRAGAGRGWPATKRPGWSRRHERARRVVTTSFPRHAGDYAGSFVGDRVRQLLADGHASTCSRRATAGSRARWNTSG